MTLLRTVVKLMHSSNWNRFPAQLSADRCSTTKNASGQGIVEGVSLGTALLRAAQPPGGTSKSMVRCKELQTFLVALIIRMDVEE